ncbi:nuclear transport factor 2 family protein [Nostoc sp. CHAB 5784]|uniref:nuclear transport factor 2 family protein n=1 Tax=Nostoc mirabile TaxID=2907820 RepID=UPI001E64A8C6|nr:nuclear transport factor 2 family protein [Nostoc mirabile]MCC5669713.1 nuclear transport factor 2 family protein [Nostoc mirabile CHAB5784]
MKTDKLRINQLSPQNYEWYLAYLQAIDTKNVELYSSFLTEDCVMHSNNQPPVQGKEAIVQFLSNYWMTFDSLEHDLLNIYGSDLFFVLEALNHYKRQDGEAVTLRAVAFTDRNQAGLVTSVRFYTDTTLIRNS